MDGITVMRRPESVSWEAVSRVLKEAHRENVRRGIRMPYPQLPPEQLYEKTEGRGGVLFVALDSERRVGTAAVVRIKKDIWCGDGGYAYCFLDTILPAYAGKGVFRRLADAQQLWASEAGLDRLLLDTNEKNVRMRKICRRNGFLPVEYRIHDDHNSVIFVKWLHGCPYPEWFVRLMFIRLKWKRKRNAKAVS